MCSEEPYTVRQKHYQNVRVKRRKQTHSPSCVFKHFCGLHLQLYLTVHLTPLSSVPFHSPLFSPYPSCSRAFSSSHSICVTFICSPLSAGTKNLITHCQPVRRGGGGRILPLFLSAPLFFNALCGGEDRRGKIYGWWDRWGYEQWAERSAGLSGGAQESARRGNRCDPWYTVITIPTPAVLFVLRREPWTGPVNVRGERGPGQISRGESWPLALFLIQPQFYLLMLLQWG